MGQRVLVLEDDPFTRVSVVTALRHFGFEVVVEEDLPGPALEKAQVARPDVAVLDLHLGKGPTGLDVAIGLRRQFPRIGLVFLTSYDDPRLLNPSLPAVPQGSVYLTKQSVSNLNSLRQAVLDSVDEKRMTSLSEVGHVYGNMTDVQVETLRLVAMGLSNSEIAKRRFVKVKSVEVTISRIAKLLGIAVDSSVNQRVHIARVYFRSIGVKIDATAD